MFSKKRAVIINIILAIMFILPGLVQAEEKASKEVIENEHFKMTSMNLDWPFNQHSGFVNYAQELVFNKDMGKTYLYKAKKAYLKGYSYISNFQINTNAYDPYIKDTFKIEALSPYGQGVYMNLVIAEKYFQDSLAIVADKIQWDPQVNTSEEYKFLVENTFKNLVLVNAYQGQFDQALFYLNKYRRFEPDEQFIEEWHSRALGNKVLIHKKYDWAFTGKLSYEYLRKQHRDFLFDTIDKRYKDNPELAKELKYRVYPSFFIRSNEAEASGDQLNTGESEKKEAGKEKTPTTK